MHAQQKKRPKSCAYIDQFNTCTFGWMSELVRLVII